jgi:glycine cleavage system H lipoate-binding protein
MVHRWGGLAVAPEGDGAMKCPFLMEMTARSCRAAPSRKIPTAAIAAADDRCTSRRYVDCPVLRRSLVQRTGLASCPLLDEQWFEYCKASPVHKLIPYSDSLASRCNGEAHRYCPLYLQRAHPAGRRRPGASITVPPHLLYSCNHMWVDVASDSSCHLGVDALVARVLGRVEGVRFLSDRDARRPTVCLQLPEADLWMEFPRRIEVTAANAHLRVDPQPVVTDPYRTGWLYAGVATTNGLETLSGDHPLRRGAEASDWMSREVERLSLFAREQGSRTLDGKPLATDGGDWIAGMAQHLDREQLLRLYHSFFSLQGDGRF